LRILVADRLRRLAVSAADEASRASVSGKAGPPLAAHGLGYLRLCYPVSFV